MDLLSLALAVTVNTSGQVPAPVPSAPAAAARSADVLVPAAPGSATATLTAAPLSVQTYEQAGTALTTPSRGRFESDREFDKFINPVSNPIFAKDPRSSTWARLLFVNNTFPGDHPFGGGNAQAYAMQVNVALTERLTLIADKDGYANLNPNAAPGTSGWLNLAAGLKYTLVRDVENQFLFSAGFMYEAPTGSADVFQNQGSGIVTPFISYGKEFACHWHFMGTHGYSFGLDQSANSSFFYHSFHLDREIGGWFYPLVELNWFQYTQGGNQLPRVIGEGDGLLNLGTQGMGGLQQLTVAAGAKFKLNDTVSAGAAYEIPLTDYKGIISNRLTIDLTLRY